MALLPPIIAKETGFSIDQIADVARSAPHRYKVYRIPKRVGRGYREIAHPSRELKVLQSWLARRLLDALPIHENGFSYRSGVGIQHHARVHASNRFLLRLDLSNFFPSITQASIRALLGRSAAQLRFQLDIEDVNLITRIVTRSGGLSIGAPSSPVLSNAILFDFDRLCSSRAQRDGVLYTRYADDLYFSTNEPGVLAAYPARVDKQLSKLRYLRLTLNVSKTIFTSKKRQRNVTGLIVTSVGEISLGHKKKRTIRSYVYRYTQHQLDDDAIAYLRGFLAYSKGVEPRFVAALQRKFGADVIRSIFAAKAISRKPYH